MWLPDDEHDQGMLANLTTEEESAQLVPGHTYEYKVETAHSDGTVFLLRLVPSSAYTAAEGGAPSAGRLDELNLLPGIEGTADNGKIRFHFVCPAFDLDEGTQLRIGAVPKPVGIGGLLCLV